MSMAKLATIVPTHSLLIVDDEEYILTTLRRALVRAGYRVVSTTDPAEALAILGREPIDILISDIDMPSMSGIELVTRVKEAHPDVVRVLLSGRGSLETALQAINSGEVYRYLTKPWDQTELLETIGQAIARLEELRRASAANRAAQRRNQLLLDLEKEHPGITTLSLLDGVYVLDVDRLDAIVAKANIPELAALIRR
jgi:DNA-binding NtrC family response regulator